MCHFTHRFEVYDGAVGHDRVVSLHQVQLAAAVLGRFVQTVDRAALGAGADGHAGDGLITADTIHGSRSASARLQLLETEWKEQREVETERERETDREGTRERNKRHRQTDRNTTRCTLGYFFCTMECHESGKCEEEEKRKGKISYSSSITFVWF